MNAPIPSGHMSGVDAAFLYLERKEIPLHIAAVFVSDGAIPYKLFVADIESKLHLLPRYTQVAVPAHFNFGHPTWQPDPSFQIGRHILRARLPRPGGDAELSDLAGRILSEPMDRRKPLWDIHVVERLKGGRGALILRVHHSLADGVSVADLLTVMFETQPGTPNVASRQFTPAQAPAPVPSVVEAIGSGVRSMLENFIQVEAGLYEVLGGALASGGLSGITKVFCAVPGMLEPVQRLPFNRPCGGERLFCWTEMDLESVQAIRAAGGGTVNDVALTVLARALARYVKAHGESVINRSVRVVCPVNLRSEHQRDKLGNRIAFMPVVLPIDDRAPLQHLKDVAAKVAAMKSARAADLIGLLGSCIGSAPPFAQAMFWSGLPKVTFPTPLLNLICTNIPGSRVPFYTLGKKIVAVYPQVPTGYELGVGCAVHSYNGKMFWGLTADAGVAPDVRRFRDFLGASFKELCRAAGVKKPRSSAGVAPRRRKAKAPAPHPVDKAAAVTETRVAAEAPAVSAAERPPDAASASSGS